MVAVAVEPPKLILGRLNHLKAVAAEVLQAEERVHADAVAAYDAEVARVVEQQLVDMPIGAIRDVSDGRLRLGPVESAGFTTIAAARNAGPARLEQIPGVGEKTAIQVAAGIRKIADSVRDAARVRFDVDRRPHQQTVLLSALRSLDECRRQVEPVEPGARHLVETIGAHMDHALLETRRIRRFFAGREQKERAGQALWALTQLDADPTTRQLHAVLEPIRNQLSSRPNEGADVWDDYLSRSVAYNGLLIEISGKDPNTEASQGFLPQEIVERIRGFNLDTTLLEVSLRGYQSFGAKYSLVQRKVIIGDEMGLGKTIEALAAISHLRTLGHQHFLVVSPASVLANWEHEIDRHTRLGTTWRLHGLDRDRYLSHWVEHGGVALTTFGTLGALPLPPMRLSAVVVDEAHYTKNPEARRTQAVQRWLTQADHAVLMTGTPMENRVEEFRTLVSHVRPDIAAGIRGVDGLAGADAFRSTVAPVYLRRNQTDVLDELPPRIETPEWLALDGAAKETYVKAVDEGNFMAMRRAAFMTSNPDDSPKLNRLLAIAGEAMDNGRKVVVFSYFRDVIERTLHALGQAAVGPLTGSVAPAERQYIVDQFTQRREPGVLISQIEAGGVGLNIQTASVVILTEPQWKPSIEDQAIARCHRMGQVRPVEVHRLLTENSVDEHMVVVLARKSALFADYVRKSVMKEATPDAIDVTDDDLVTELAGQAEQERRIIELERQRLGIDS